MHRDGLDLEIKGKEDVNAVGEERVYGMSDEDVEGQGGKAGEGKRWMVQQDGSWLSLNIGMTDNRNAHIARKARKGICPFDKSSFTFKTTPTKISPLEVTNL